MTLATHTQPPANYVKKRSAWSIKQRFWFCRFDWL